MGVPFSFAPLALVSRAIANTLHLQLGCWQVTATTHWSHGFDLAVLQRVVDRFADVDAPYVLGAFTAVTRPTVAEWMAAGELRDIAAVPLVVSRRVRQVSTVRDFTGRTLCRLPVGALHVRRVAVASAAECDALVRQLARERRVLFEGWAEYDAHHEIARRAGLDRIGSKVRSSSEIVALWARGLPAAERDATEALAMHQLDLRFDVSAARDELSAVDTWVDHYSNYNARHTWHAVALRSYGGDALTIEKPAEMTQHWRRAHADALALDVSDTPLMSELPACAAICDAVPGRKQRVRLMRLAARRGELQRHTDIGDPDSGIADDRVARVHVPLVTSSDVHFTAWELQYGATVDVQMAAGEAWYLDTRKPHRATNTGDADRVHLVIDVHSSPALRALL